MKIGIYSPYLDTVGGGERYILTIAEVLSKAYQIDVFLDNHLQTLDFKAIQERNSKLLDLNLSKVEFIKAPFGRGSSVLERWKFLKSYDLLFYLTDGSVFYSSAKKSILHIQSPIKVSNAGLWKKIKQTSWDLVIYNSQFTKHNCQNSWDIKGQVVYPPVNTEVFKKASKKKQILTVGRFFGYLKDKKHKLMIDAFKKMVDSQKIRGWVFHLAGGAGEGDIEYIKELESLAEGYPIYFYPNLEYKKLLDLYSESSIYWHAAGFGETDPAKMEHFGITTVEAMAAGCVPLVINKGGQMEIVEEGVNGMLWDTLADLETKTSKLVENGALLRRLSKGAIEKSKIFSKQKFAENISEIVQRYVVS